MIELQNICFEYGSEEQNIAGRGALHNINLHIPDADQIFVIENGTVAETGTHNELLANGEIYSNMWRAHMSVKDSEQEVEPRA